jgi:hypothetical protein
MWLDEALHRQGPSGLGAEEAVVTALADPNQTPHRAEVRLLEKT